MSTYYEKEAVRLNGEVIRLQLENARLRGDLNDVRQGLKTVREWAGDNLPASSGLTLVGKLEALYKGVK